MTRADMIVGTVLLVVIVLFWLGLYTYWENRENRDE